MIDTSTRLRLMIGAVLITGTTALAGCGPTPVSRTNTVEQTTTIAPTPEISTITATTEEIKPPVVIPHHPRARYAMHRRPIHRAEATLANDKTTTVETTVTPATTTLITRKSTETTTTGK
jgi:hypothetical protein